MPLTKDILTPREVAEYLQLAPETVYRHIREGKLAASRVGRQYRVPRENVELFLLATPTAGEAQLCTSSTAQIQEWFEEDQIVRRLAPSARDSW